MAGAKAFISLLLLHASLQIGSHGAKSSVTAADSGRTLQPRDRLRRKASAVDTSSPVEYMVQLRESLTDSSGKPRADSEDPTNVWCLLDKDLVDQWQKPKPSNRRCKAEHIFRFNTDALLGMLQESKIYLLKAVLRTYIDVINRYFKQQDSIAIHFNSIFAITELESNSTLSVFGGVEEMRVTRESSGWVELNLTSGLTEIQSLSGKILGTVELRVGITVDCVANRKVPITLADPATVPLSQAPRRLRLSKLQPMLLVFLSDEELKTEIKQEAQAQPLGDNLDIQEREKRERGGCHVEDFTVNFHNIDLTYILAPFEYNARRCVGTCSHSVLRYHGHLATNHAKIMASAVAIKNYDPQVPFNTQPSDPCCVPTNYESLSLLILDNLNGLSYAVYPTMIVTGCGCR